MWREEELGSIAPVPNVLIHADTIRSAELRHEVPILIGDPFVYVEQNGSRRVYTSSLEAPRLEELQGLEVVLIEELGFDELMASGRERPEIERELVLRACRHAGVGAAVVPRAFPLDTADHLRANGVELRPDGGLFDERRRVKTGAELEGIQRAQGGAEAAMGGIRARLREGGDVTCEELQAIVLRTFTEHGLTAPDSLIVSHGAQTAIGHEAGHGRIERGEPIVCDLFPQDTKSGCYADMTRTFCVGEPPELLGEFHRLCRESLERVYGSIRAGVTGKELHAISCGPFEEAGYKTQLTKEPGEVPDEGFLHSLGHGVGLEVHEEPGLGRTGGELVEGDVVAIEPGLYRKGFGGCRLEDLVRVTADGCERLTDFPYDLTP
jgi:Xaa-Pro aminopeptidase